MNVSDIADGIGFQMRLETYGASTDDLDSLIDRRVHLTGSAENPTIMCGEGSVDVSPYDRQAERLVEGIFGAEAPTLCTAVAASDTGSEILLHIEGRKFDQKFRPPEPVDIAIDEKIIDTYRDVVGNAGIEPDQVFDVLKQDLIVDATKSERRALIISAGPEVDELPGGFRIHGETFVAIVKRGPDNKYLIDRLAQRSSVSNLDQHPQHLLFGSISIRDHQAANRSDVEIGDVTASSDSYLQLWRTYNQISSIQSLRDAREFGYYRYDKVYQRSDRAWEFQLQCKRSEFADLLRSLNDIGNASLSASNEVPDPLTSEVGPEELQDWIDTGLYSREDTIFSGDPKSGAHNRTEKILVLQATGRSERDEVGPPSNGYLYLSLIGDQVSLRRRKRAAIRIEKGNTPLRQLGLLLEEKDVPVARRRDIKVMTQEAAQKFGGTPNQKQEIALNIALNTPDIAIIQGPPGTGKTRLISALQTRLSNKAETAGGVSGEILLTSYQHTAVDNVADASSVYGLPAVRIGGKGRRDERIGDHADRWRQTLINRLDDEIDDASFSKPAGVALQHVSRKLATYQVDPGSVSKTIALLDEIEKQARPHVSESLLESLREKRRDLRLTTTNLSSGVDLAALRRQVRALRTESSTFRDDGALTAENLLYTSLSALSLGEDDERLLEHAADWTADDPPPFLDNLRDLKERLLNQVLNEDRDNRKDLRNTDVEQIIQEIIAELRGIVETTSDGAVVAARNFQDALENDPAGIREALSCYSAVLASTCSQADSGLLRDAKGIDYDEDRVPTFETVVVDEAARANPLDLFIPLSMASRRIVLVGDQNQLPHMLEPGVEDELSKEVSDENEVQLRQSLFERLYDYAQRLEEKDGVRRCIRLTEQYRMHPDLGEYVGENFYSDDASGGLHSPRPEEDFKHDLSRHDGKAAAWVDVPRNEGGEVRRRSKSRPAEARRVAAELRHLLEEDTEAQYTYGVITFYRAQVDAIYEALQDQGIATQTEDGYEVRDKWRRMEKEDGSVEIRIEVGTVDAFQGKEFDVVLLSMTRSCSPPPQSERQAYSKYGHIMRPNRLCVAMSRQKRLLVVIGDAQTATTEEAEKYISALYNFYQLCNSDAGHVLSSDVARSSIRPE
jgi:hypothetical protein